MTTSAKTESSGYLDVGLESKRLDIEEATEMLRTFPTINNVRAVARSMQALNMKIRRLDQYGSDYERQGQGFIETCMAARDAALPVPEEITRTDPGADRSAHALLTRSLEEIRQAVQKSCGIDTH